MAKCYEPLIAGYKKVQNSRQPNIIITVRLFNLQREKFLQYLITIIRKSISKAKLLYTRKLKIEGITTVDTGRVLL